MSFQTFSLSPYYHCLMCSLTCDLCPHYLQPPPLLPYPQLNMVPHSVVWFLQRAGHAGTQLFLAFFWHNRCFGHFNTQGRC